MSFTHDPPVVGQTIDLEMVEALDGPQWITIDSPIDQIPLWIRDVGVDHQLR